MLEKATVLAVLTAHIGQANGISGQDLTRDLSHATGKAVDKREVRRVIERLRLDGHHICAHPSSGYFIANNEDELNNSCEFLYQRAMTSLEQISRMKNVSLPDLRGQLRLPT